MIEKQITGYIFEEGMRYILETVRKKKENFNVYFNLQCCKWQH